VKHTYTCKGKDTCILWTQ